MKILLITLLSIVLNWSPLQAEERYFVALFAAQAPDGDARRSHTFATFLKLDIGAPDEDGNFPTETMASLTISWMPANGQIRLVARPESGRNFDLRESLAWAKERGLDVTMRGPFEISADLYKRAVKQKKWLDSGRVTYKALDVRFRGGSAAVNCIHAVSDIIPGELLFTGAAHGDSASDLVAEHFRPHLADPKRVHAWATRHLDSNGERLVARKESNMRIVSTPDFAE